MPNTISTVYVDRAIEELQRNIEAPDIYSFSLMTPKQQRKATRVWLKKLRRILK